MDKLSQLAARAEIGDAMVRYARAVDRRDWPAMQACFHSDATDHHGDFNGPIEEFVPWVSAMHSQVDHSTHFLGNSFIEFASDTTALVETYFLGLLVLGSASEGHRAMLLTSESDIAPADRTEVDVRGRYLDVFEIREQSWLIARRIVAFDTVRAAPASLQTLKQTWAHGRRNSTDPVYALRQQLGLAPS